LTLFWELKVSSGIRNDFLSALGREQGRGHIFTPSDPKVGGFFMIDIEGTMVIEVPT
jgi:hypothetical protein